MDKDNLDYFRISLHTIAQCAGGRSEYITSGYRPDWNIGNKTESGGVTFNGATLELFEMLTPGRTTRNARLHPLVKEYWKNLKSGTQITMHEGLRIVGVAVVNSVPTDFLEK